MSKSRFLTEIDSIYTTKKSRSLVDVGGIKSRTDLTNKSIKELLKDIVQPYKAPTIEKFILTDTNTDLEKDGISKHKIGSINFILEYWSDIITSYTTSYSINSGQKTTIDTLSKSTVNDSDFNEYRIEITKSNIDINASQTINDQDDTVTYTLTVSDGKTNVSKSIIHNYIRPYYYGTNLSTTSFNINDLTSYTKVIKKVSNNMSLSFIGKDGPTYSIIIYPISYGKLKGVKDPNGFTQNWSLIKNGDLDYFTISKSNNLNLNYYVYKSDVSQFSTVSYKFEFGS